MPDCPDVPDWAADGEKTPPSSQELQNGFERCTLLRPSLLNWLFGMLTCNIRGALERLGVLEALVVPATRTRKGIIEIATEAEVKAGTDTVRAVTPADLKSAFDEWMEERLGDWNCPN